VLRTVKLSGALGKKFGREWRFDIRTPAEAFRALAANNKGFVAHLAQAAQKGLSYRVFVDNRPIGEDTFLSPTGAETIRISPVVRGQKSGAVAGILMIAAAVALTVCTMGAGGALVIAGATVMSASTVSAVTVGLVMGGISALLLGNRAPTLRNAANQQPSYSFSGAVNTTAQGSPVPLCYGKMVVGSQVISAGLEAGDIPLGT
jgi:predicted phage tail protein